MNSTRLLATARRSTRCATITDARHHLAGDQGGSTRALITVPGHGSTINDHRRITRDDHRGAVPLLRAGNLVANASQAFPMRVGGHGRTNHNTTMISAISEDDKGLTSPPFLSMEGM
jgi:hypothetical protein